MKKLIALILMFLPSVCLTEGPILKHQDSITQREFDNVYRDLRKMATSASVDTDIAALTSPVILQVVTANSAVDFTTTSNSYQTTNLSASITPSTTTSTVLVFASGALVSDAIGSSGVIATLYRDTTDLMTGGNGGFTSLFTSIGAGNFGGHVTTYYEDSPNTTSSVTYSVRIKNEDGSTTVRFGNARLATMVLMEVAQ